MCVCVCVCVCVCLYLQPLCIQMLASIRNGDALHNRWGINSFTYKTKLGEVTPSQATQQRIEAAGPVEHGVLWWCYQGRKVDCYFGAFIQYLTLCIHWDACKIISLASDVATMTVHLPICQFTGPTPQEMQLGLACLTLRVPGEFFINKWRSHWKSTVQKVDPNLPVNLQASGPIGDLQGQLHHLQQPILSDLGACLLLPLCL